jgi:APA family basic amino acid/polyamine antiporter
MSAQIFEKKPLDRILKDADVDSDRPHALKRALSAFDLVVIGIGCVIGTGIFVLTGEAAARAGPGVIFSYVVCAIACIFAALCYAEFAAMIPIAGSAYTYSYATLGELIAWIIGWDLILEYGVATSAVAIGWSTYFKNIMGNMGVHPPAQFMATPFDQVTNAAGKSVAGICNVPAVIITLIVTIILVIGIKESANFNAIMVAIKTFVLIFFVAVGATWVNKAFWGNLVPLGWIGMIQESVQQAGQQLFNYKSTTLWEWLVSPEKVGVLAGASIVFFAYIGFDAVSTAAEEARNPQRDLPIGIIGSLVICTVLYILVSLIMTGLVPWEFYRGHTAAPLADALTEIKKGWAASIVALGAISGITSVLLVTLLGQSRIFFVMARDGLLPGIFSRVHPRFKTPYAGTMLTGALVALGAGLLPIGIVAELANIGTLFAFILVSIGILILRKTDPDARRPFVCPMVPLVPFLSILFCFFLILGLPPLTWARFAAWLAAGLFIYFIYGIRHSRLRARS